MTTVLLLVDVQKNMLEPPEPVPDADAIGQAIKDLLGRARLTGTTVIHIRNSGGDGDPDAPGTPGWDLVHGSQVSTRWTRANVMPSRPPAFPTPRPQTPPPAV